MRALLAGKRRGRSAAGGGCVYDNYANKTLSDMCSCVASASGAEGAAGVDLRCTELARGLDTKAVYHYFSESGDDSTFVADIVDIVKECARDVLADGKLTHEDIPIVLAAVGKIGSELADLNRRYGITGANKATVINVIRVLILGSAWVTFGPTEFALLQAVVNSSLRVLEVSLDEWGEKMHFLDYFKCCG